MNTFSFYWNEIFESYKDVRKVWIDQGNDPTQVELYTDRFKSLSTRNIIKPPDNDITRYIKIPFEDFKKYVDQMATVITKNQQKQLIGQDAEKIFENDKVLIVVPKTYEASCKYGSGTKWCTTSQNPEHWDSYAEHNVKFYYILTKDTPKEDPWYKVAIAVYQHSQDQDQKPPMEVYDSTDQFLTTQQLTTFLNRYNLTEEMFTNIWDPEKWLDLQDYSIGVGGLININGNVDLIGLKFKKLPFKFGKIRGSFDCSNNQLTTLEGAPIEVSENFFCSHNQLASLQGAPKKVGKDFFCNGNQLKSLEGSPESVISINCMGNQLKSLEYAPTKVYDSFLCSGNTLTSLKGAPKEIRGHFECSYNKIKSLEGAPQSVGGHFNCGYNDNLVSLEGIPKEIYGNFNGRFIPGIKEYDIDDFSKLSKIHGWIITDRGTIKTTRGLDYLPRPPKIDLRYVE